MSTSKATMGRDRSIALLFILSTVSTWACAFVIPAPSSPSTASPLSASITEDIGTEISAAKSILVRAAETKGEDSEIVIGALLSLEKLMRKKAKAEGGSFGEDMKAQLDGDWRLIFTTGTADTQQKYGKINYFPLKATQTFRTIDEKPMRITNGIFVGDFPLIKFFGEMDFDVVKRKLEFDFNELLLFNLIKVNLGKGEAAKLGASSGLGSESNIENAKRGRQAFFNWISADEQIATARGGGGGLALWKRVDREA
jgi:PAP_fibrillin